MENVVRGRGQAAGRAAVLKRVNAGLPGSVRFLERFKEDLVCVRYRRGKDAQFVTVEIVVETRAVNTRGPRPDEVVLVAMGQGETELNRRARSAGAVWDRERAAWRMTRAVAESAGLAGQIVAVATGGHGSSSGG